MRIVKEGQEAGNSPGRDQSLELRGEVGGLVDAQEGGGNGGGLLILPVKVGQKLRSSCMNAWSMTGTTELVG